MDDPTIPETNAVYRERLQQAVRVMKDLAANPAGKRFNMKVYAAEDEDGTLVGCIAGFCALDPWFQERGLVMELGEMELGETAVPSVLPESSSARKSHSTCATTAHPIPGASPSTTRSAR